MLIFDPDDEKFAKEFEQSLQVGHKSRDTEPEHKPQRRRSYLSTDSGEADDEEEDEDSFFSPTNTKYSKHMLIRANLSDIIFQK